MADVSLYAFYRSICVIMYDPKAPRLVCNAVGQWEGFANIGAPVTHIINGADDVSIDPLTNRPIGIVYSRPEDRPVGWQFRWLIC